MYRQREKYFTKEIGFESKQLDKENKELEHKYENRNSELRENEKGISY